MSIELGKQQKQAIELLLKWWKGDRQLFEIAGLAGTGKSTIISHFIKLLGLKREEVIFCSFTGKATQLLNMKGLPAKTIHSTFYEMRHVPIHDDDGKEIKEYGRVRTEPKFVPRDNLNPNIKLIVVDEAGAVGARLAITMLSFGVKIIALGDLHQLPPVLDKTYFLKRPDISLTEIMRQSEGNPIIYLSQRVIKNLPLESGTYGKCKIIYKDEMLEKEYLSNDIIVTSRNSIRENINTHIKRDILGKDITNPCVGDKLVCRQNQWDKCLNDELYLINGLMGYVEDIDTESWKRKTCNIDFRPDFLEDDYFFDIPLDLEYFRLGYEERKTYGRFGSGIKFEPGWCISVYLSQGSEYNNVLYIDDNYGSNSYLKRTRYTAITRAKESITIVKERPKKYFNFYKNNF